MSDKTMNPFKMKTANIVAFLFVIFCFGFVYLLVYKEVPSSNKDLINFLAGILFGTGLGGVVYWLYNYRKDGQPETEVKSLSFNCPVCGKPFNSVNTKSTIQSKARPVINPSKPTNDSWINDEEGTNPDYRLDV
jgi:hypothetical protein